MGYSATLVSVAAVLFDASRCEGYHSSLPVSFVQNLHRAQTNPSATVTVKAAPFSSSSSTSPTRKVRAFFPPRFAQQNPEFSIVDNLDRDDDHADVQDRDFFDDEPETDKVDFRQRKISSGLLIGNEETLPLEARSEDSNAHSNLHPKISSSVEYAALQPGTVVHVQVGDLALARKAWKKRRRTGSPILVPCSILNVDRRSMVRWNLIFLLEKFGQSTKDGIELSLASLARSYRTYLKSALKKQATALGYETNEDMVTALFNKQVQDSYGIYLETKQNIEDEEVRGNMLYLKAALTRRKGHARSSNTPLLQFRRILEGDPDFVGTDGDGEENSEAHRSEILTHTGLVRALKEDSELREYTEFPLSAALRVSQKDDLDSGRVSEGSTHAAVIFEYDKIGDGGSPLLTLSLNPGRVRENMKIQPDRRYKRIEKPTHLLKDLSVGDGPFEAKVVKLLGYEALVDLSVGRHVATVGNTVRVLGALRFKDSVELASDRTAAEASLSSAAIPWMEFEDDEDDDFEESIESSVDELDFMDEDYDDDDDDDDAVEGEDVAETLLSLRKESSFEEGIFELGEEEEDISDLFEVNESGELVYRNHEHGSEVILDDADMDEGDDDDNHDEIDIVDQGSAGGFDDDDETDEVIGSLFSENEDGSVTYHDPESGESMVIDSDDDDYEDLMILKSLVAERIANDETEEADDYEDASNVDRARITFDDEYEDISDEVMAGLYSTNEDGSISYHDPETGETFTVDKEDEEYDGMMLIKSLVDEYLPTVESEGENARSRKAATTSDSLPTPISPSLNQKLVSKRLHVGDVIKVYIMGVSKQSNRLRVTTNPLVKGRKVKDIKKEENVQKKKNRLKKQLGGSLKEIYKLKGKECDGTVKAKSKTGEWLYVQPELEGLPVGVATWHGEDLVGISPGEKVRVRISGVDEARGQLSLHVIGKLLP